MNSVSSVEQLEEIYGAPSETALVKVSDSLTSDYAALIAASPFAILATSGPEGLDCSPRGGEAGFVRVVGPRTLLMPDRRGNNRADSLRNIVRDPRVALLFLIPGVGTTLRVNGTALISIDDDLCQSFSVEGYAPRSVIVVETREVYFQCARAILRSDLWNPSRYVDPKSLPSPGEILRSMSDGRTGGARYDDAWPARAKTSLW